MFLPPFHSCYSARKMRSGTWCLPWTRRWEVPKRWRVDGKNLKWRTAAQDRGGCRGVLEEENIQSRRELWGKEWPGERWGHQSGSSGCCAEKWPGEVPATGWSQSSLSGAVTPGEPRGPAPNIVWKLILCPRSPSREEGGVKPVENRYRELLTFFMRL